MSARNQTVLPDKDALIDKWYDAFEAWMIVCYGKSWKTKCEPMEIMSRQIGFLAGWSQCVKDLIA